MKIGVVEAFSEKTQRFMALASDGTFSTFAFLVPQDVKIGDSVEWQSIAGQARMTVKNKRTGEDLHVNALAFDASQAIAEAYLGS